MAMAEAFHTPRFDVPATGDAPVGHPVPVHPGGSSGTADDSVDDPGTFSSALVLGPGSWRQFVVEVLTLVVATGAVVAGWLVWEHLRTYPELLAIAVLNTGWCLYVLGSALRRLRRRRGVLGSGIPTLFLDDLGVRVRHPFGNLDGAYLTWTDCAAAVVSRPPTAGRTTESYRAYVEFVAVAPDRIEGAPRQGDQRRVLLDRPADQVRLVWMELTGVGRRATEVAAWLRAYRPELTVVDSLDRQSASTL